MFSDEFIKQLEKKDIYKNVYSEEEIVIGDYFGKPLYRKSIIVDGNQESVPHNINNLNEVVKYSGVLYRIESVIKSQILPHSDINSLFIADVNYFSETTIEMIFGDSIKNKITGFNLTLEYTKTTD